MVLVENVSVALDGKPVLHDVSFRIETGTVAGYVGPNGAGKTTTMRLLTGALQPDAGPCRGSTAWTSPWTRSRRSGASDSSPNTATSTRASRRPSTSPSSAGCTGSARRRSRCGRRPTSASGRLADSAHLSMTGFSKGMKQKVLLSAAMLHDPPVLLLDEPLSGLDAHAVLQTRALLRTLVARGTTVFYSSHLLDAVEKVADFVVVIRDGRILQTGTPAEITAGAGGASLEDAFGRLTAAADAYDEAEALVSEAFGESARTA